MSTITLILTRLMFKYDVCEIRIVRHVLCELPIQTCLPETYGTRRLQILLPRETGVKKFM